MNYKMFAMMSVLAIMSAGAQAESGKEKAGREYNIPQVSVPKSGNKVVVNLPQNRVFLFQDGDMVGTWKVGPGKPSTPTPIGKWKIGQIKDNPTWYIPASIQAEYNKKGIKHKGFVPPGPKNPLGPVFIRMGQTSIGLHGTNNPNSVGGFPSHGCIRMKSKEAVELSEGLRVGDEAEILYQPIVVNVADNGEVWLSVNKDIYKKGAKYSVEDVQNALDKLDTTATSFELEEESIVKALNDKHGDPVLIGNVVS